MKKALAILSVILLGLLTFTSYETLLCYKSFNAVNEKLLEMDEYVDTYVQKAANLATLQKEKDNTLKTLLTEDTGSKQWQNIKEILKQIEK